MAFFFLKLLPKRPDFPANMTDDERAVMHAHSRFLAEQLAAKTLVVAGPVMAKEGAFGMAVYDVPSLDAAEALSKKDPANAIGAYEIAPMASALARPA